MLSPPMYPFAMSWLSNAIITHVMLLISVGEGQTSGASLTFPDSKVYGANMGPTWGRQDPGGPHVGPHEPCSQGCLSEIKHE